MRVHRPPSFLLALLAAAGPGLPVAPARAAQDLPGLIEAAALAHAAGQPGRAAARVGVQARSLRPCAQVELFMPPGSKPWGEVLVGVRCADTAPWTRFVPVRLSVTVRHAAAQLALPAGHRLSAADVQWLDADLATLPRDPVLDESLLAGAVTLQPLAAGAPLRRQFLKAQPVIQQGQVVKVVTVGEGFMLSAEGKAQASAAPGQPVAVRMAGGQLVTATARPDGTAEKRP